MHSGLALKNAVAAIRVSTTKQGVDGDSPEAQKEQIERFAASKGVVIKKFFVFLESASKEQQPMQEAINYCKDSKNQINLFIIKSIDRFTRGGSLSYDLLKTQLEANGVSLVDIYGIISSEQVNTLEHLGFEYKWSKYSPSKKSEILEAERSKDELRDIMSRMIGAEIRYTQMGFWMRKPPYGFISEKIETRNGKRCVLRPHPEESKYIIKMFDLKARGTLYDTQIVEEINNLGYRARTRQVRSKHDRTKIIATSGGAKLTVKSMQRLLAKPIYAGINVEKWTDNKPVKCAFDGLVSIAQFNRANKGKQTIIQDDQGDFSIIKEQSEQRYMNKGLRSPDFPYRKFVTCSTCEKPLLGSSSRGKSGTYYPAYHCSNHGHYFRVTKQELEDTIAEFISSIRISQDHIDTVMSVIEAEWVKRQQNLEQELETLESHISELRVEADMTASKIKLLTNQTAIKYIEEDIVRIESQINALSEQRDRKALANPSDFERLKVRVKYFLEHLDELLIKQIDPVKKAQLFGALFDKLPTYENLKSGTQKTPHITGVNPVFAFASLDKSRMVIPRRIELLLPG